MNKKIKYMVACFMLSVVNYSIAAPNEIQEGYNYQAQKINIMLENQSAQLSDTYDFEKISENGRLVNSLVCEEDNTQYYNGIKLKKSEICHIKYKARSVYKNENTKEVLTWRDFLIIPVDKEIVYYKDNKDFKNGMEKAKQKILENIVNLKEMYKGMILYKSLIEQGMISENNNKNEPIINIESNDKVIE